MALLGLVAIGFPFESDAEAATGGTIAGVAYQDMNRNRVQEAGESPLADHRLYLFDGAGTTYLGTAFTDAFGHYAFTGLADGDYRVQYESGSWNTIRDNWIPTTSGSIFPSLSVTLAGSATADFGWRPITRSTTLGSPMSSYVAPTGLRIESYNDALTAQEINADLASGPLLGGEGATITVRFDYGSANSTSTGVQGTPGSYSGYNAVSYVTYQSWLDSGDRTMFHEYGHAWSLYYAYMVQQDPSLAGYLQVRGLVGDSRVNSSYAWNVNEMIAEDYRQLFGTANAQRGDQMNRDIPRAVDVPGLRDYLQGSFRDTRGSGGISEPDPVVQPLPAALVVSGLSVSPQPVVKSGTVRFDLSSSARVTVEIRIDSGALVRTLATDKQTTAGANSLNWDRKDGAGRRVRSGTYSAVVRATDGTTSQSAATPFTVS